MWSDWSHDSLSSMSIDEAPAKYHANLCQLRNPDDSTLNHSSPGQIFNLYLGMISSLALHQRPGPGYPTLKHISTEDEAIA